MQKLLVQVIPLDAKGSLVQSAVVVHLTMQVLLEVLQASLPAGSIVVAQLTAAVQLGSFTSMYTVVVLAIFVQVVFLQR